MGAFTESAQAKPQRGEFGVEPARHSLLQHAAFSLRPTAY
jgi:hypothetical protein